MRRAWPAIAFFAAAALAPVVVRDAFLLDGLVLILLWGAAGAAWNVAGGYAGQVSIGHAAFFGLGAYSAALLGTKWGVSPWIGLVVGAVLATAFGLIVALHPPLAIWTTGWAIAGWKIGGGMAGFIGWGLLPIVTIALGAPVTESLLVLLLAVVLIGRRMQGNPGDAMDRASMMSRAVYDRDLIGDVAGDTADDPLTQ